MSLEIASFISQLVPTNPAASDNVSQGDDHLRLLKAVLQAQFPNLGAVAMNLTAAQLNSSDYATATATGTLSGCTTAPTGSILFTRIGPMVFARLPALIAVSNTNACVLAFTPPAGFWTSDTLLLPAPIMDNGNVLMSLIEVGGGASAFQLIKPGSTFATSGSKGLPYNTVLAYPANL